MAKILVIEDNPTNMKLVSLLLERQGHTVERASSAEQGIEFARRSRPEIVIMDIQLPGMDGLAATRILKTDEETKNVKILALTALAMNGDKERIQKAGCDAYVAKPLRYKEFLSALDGLLPKTEAGC